jgi:hypothetical protein
MSNRRINQSAIAPSAPIDTNNARPTPLSPGNQIHSGQLWSILTAEQQQALFHSLVSVSRALVNNPKSRIDSEEANDEQD